jgi:hypothetical protein
MSWTMRDGLDPDTIDEIEKQNDRGAAIIAGALLEDFVVDAIKTRLLPDEKVIDQFLTGMGPLATFSAKIDMAYLLKIVTSDCRRVMHIIRRVRNEFAHGLQPLSFETPRIQDMCSNLITTPEGFEQLVKEQLAIELSPKTIPKLLEFTEQRFWESTGARSAYVNTVKTITFCLALGIS